MDKHKKNDLVFVFPGQGSQSIGMLNAVSEVFPLVKETFEQASDSLNFDLWQLVSEGTIEQLSQTEKTQPAMLAAGVAMWRVWNSQSTTIPGWIAGHSLGEYTAMVCADAIQFEDAIMLVAERGKLMQQAVPEGLGAMAAIIGLQDQQVIDLCQESSEGQVLSAVNFNAPGQVVIAGNVTAVDRAIIASKSVGAKIAKKLPVSVPSHCSLMENAADKLAEKLANIDLRIPNISLIHNVDTASHNDITVIRNVLREQLFKPVRWVESIQYLHDKGATMFVECGPGKVLMGLNKRIVKTAEHSAIYDPATLEKVLERLDG